MLRRLAGVPFLVLIVVRAAAAGQASGTPTPDPLEGRPIVSVTVTGLRHITRDVVLRQIASRPGQPYRRAAADHDVELLDRLGVFGDVTLTASELPDGVHVEIDVVETLRVLPAVALAITDENGASIGPAVKLLSVRGTPHEVTLTTRFGGETLLEFSEKSPDLVSDRWWHSARVSLRNRFNELDQFNERSVDLDARLGLRQSERFKAGAILQVYRVRSDESGITLSDTNVDTFVSGGAVVEYDTRNLWREPSTGWWNSADVLWRTGAGRSMTIDLDVRRYQPVAARHTIVATSLLTLQTGTRGEDIPTYSDYALGGENTVRGWSFNARRGKDQFINTVEYRYTAIKTRTFRVFGVNLYGGVALAAFADAGSAWNTSAEFDDGVIAGGGIGLRVFVPFVNMIRIDFALGDGHFHARLGVNEKAVAARNRVR